MFAPARGRGLKLWVNSFTANSFVRPRAGAWIETARIGGIMICKKVRPRAGAWIETAMPPAMLRRCSFAPAYPLGPSA